MDPLCILTCLVGVVNYLYDASEKVQQNREECRRLATHANAVFRAIQGEIDSGVSPYLLERLQHLKRTLVDLNFTLDALSNQSTLKKMLWRGDIADRIATAYRGLGEAVELFNLGTRLDLHRFEVERDTARRADMEQLHRKLTALQHSDHQILDHLEIQNAQLQDAMLSLHRSLDKHFLALDDNPALRFLKQAMLAMQRRSGGMTSTSDTFVITSLEVVIHWDKKIGEGGFGRVFEAQWQGSQVAVKVLDRRVPSTVIQEEINVWKRLRHPNILQFFGACSTADPPFLVSALKSQGDVVNFLRHKPLADRFKIIYGSAHGLRYLHENDVVHGDLKASNVLIDEHGNACLCDFGLSKIRTHTTTACSPLSAPSIHGSPRWMAPERMSVGILNKATDIYSFGMTVYEIFTGTPPFANIPDTLLFSKVVDRGERPPRPTEWSITSRGLDKTFWTLIKHCWAQKARDRPIVTAVVRRLTTMQPRRSDVSPTTGEVPSTTADCVSIPLHKPLSTFTTLRSRAASLPTAGDDMSSNEHENLSLQVIDEQQERQRSLLRGKLRLSWLKVRVDNITLERLAEL